MPNTQLKAEIERLIRIGLKEDVGSGDITSTSIIPARQTATAVLIARQRGVIAGLNVAKTLYRQLSRKIKFISSVNDGDVVSAGHVIASVVGPARSLLTGERLALNFLQRLSGIATLTRQFVEKVEDTGAEIYDTRKTTPGWRHLEKYAVRMGGGKNHRMGLYDQVLIKDNHLRLAGSSPSDILTAVAKACEKVSGRIKIEVETENLAQVEAAASAGADIIMLDNMSVSEMKHAVRIIRSTLHKNRKPCIIEASGGITLQNVKRTAKTGVDRISLGALTHSPPALDIAMEIW